MVMRQARPGPVVGLVPTGGLAARVPMGSDPIPAGRTVVRARPHASQSVVDGPGRAGQRGQVLAGGGGGPGQLGRPGRRRRASSCLPAASCGPGEGGAPTPVAVMRPRSMAEAPGAGRGRRPSEASSIWRGGLPAAAGRRNELCHRASAPASRHGPRRRWALLALIVAHCKREFQVRAVGSCAVSVRAGDISGAVRVHGAVAGAPPGVRSQGGR